MLNKINKKYGNKVALTDFTARLEEGIYGLLGPNGAGKSTLIHILTANLKSDGGSILYDGKDIFKMGKAYREILSFVPQQQCYYESFSLMQYLSYIAALKNMKKKNAEEQIERVLQQVNLEDAAKKRMGELSGGMRQRAMIAQALLNNPKLIILDEPTAGLDPRERIRIRNLISKLSKDKIILIATHVVTDVEFIAKEILMLKQGVLLYQKSPEELQKMISEKVFEIRTDEAHMEEIMEKYRVSNLLRDEDSIILRVLSETKPHENCVSVKPDLEDVYLYLFEQETAFN